MKRGSALLIVLITMSVLLAAIACSWRGAVYLHELALARQEYEQRYWRYYALAQWAIALAKENYEAILSQCQAQPLVVQIHAWPAQFSDGTNDQKKDQEGSGIAVAFRKKASGRLCIQVEKQKKSILACELCKIVADEKPVFAIANWKEG